MVTNVYSTRMENQPVCKTSSCKENPSSLYGLSQKHIYHWVIVVHLLRAGDSGLAETTRCWLSTQKVVLSQLNWNPFPIQPQTSGLREGCGWNPPCMGGRTVSMHIHPTQYTAATNTKALYTPSYIQCTQYQAAIRLFLLLPPQTSSQDFPPSILLCLC